MFLDIPPKEAAVSYGFEGKYSELVCVGEVR